MSNEIDTTETEQSFDRSAMYRIAGGMIAGAATVAPFAMAATLDLNTTIGPLLDGVADLIPSMINLVIAAVPLAIVGGLVGALLKWFPDLFSFGK